MSRTNEFGQPIGEPLEGWTAPALPPPSSLVGDHVTLEPLAVAHVDGLWTALRAAPGSLWTYLAVGPFASRDALAGWIAAFAADEQIAPYAVVVDGRPVGLLSYLRMDPAMGCIEIGWIVYSPALQRTTAATETIHLLLAHAFDLGYRRVEWKCDVLNAPSRAAADRYGFTYEGTFRHAAHYKDRNRDTAWYSITDREWPALDRAFRDWLAPNNFDTDGAQRRSLREHRARLAAERS